jgi:hypothetical protein
LAAAGCHWRQHCDGKRGGSVAAAEAAAAAAAAARRQRGSGGGRGQCIGSTTAVGMAAAAAATAMLTPRTAAVATKTPAATAMAGAHTTINNQLREAAAMATETVAMKATMMTMETKATATAAAWQEHSIGGCGSAMAA